MYGPDSRIYKTVLTEEQIKTLLPRLLDELKLQPDGSLLEEHEAHTDGRKDIGRTPLDTPASCQLDTRGKTWPFKYRMMLHIGDETAEAPDQNIARGHNPHLQKRYDWPELPVITSLRNLVADFFGYEHDYLPHANLYFYSGKEAKLGPHKDNVVPGVEGGLVYTLTFSSGGPWKFVWKAREETASLNIESGSVNVLGRLTNKLGTHEMPPSNKRSPDAWRISLNFRPKAIAPEPVLFYRNHPFSNFWICDPFLYTLPHCCPLPARSGPSYTVTTSEEAIMLAKAALMGDDASLQKLEKLKKSAKAPNEAKKIGRRVKPWDLELWKRNVEEIARSAVSQKFNSDTSLKRKLLESGGARLAEASKNDAIWGIGMNENNPKAKDPENWPEDSNILGRALEAVREELGGCAATAKRRKQHEVERRWWGFFIRNAVDPSSKPMADMKEYLANLTDKDSLEIRRSARRQVFGGRTTMDKVPPVATKNLMLAVAAALRNAGETDAAEKATLCTEHNNTVNIYEKGAKLPFHRDPADYEPFVVCVALGGPRSMSFLLDSVEMDLTLNEGDIYVIRGETGYTATKHGMRTAAKNYSASLTGRIHRQCFWEHI